MSDFLDMVYNGVYMKAKIGTVLDQDLLRRTRSAAAQEGKRLNQVIEEALSDHLKRKKKINAPGVATRTAGCLRLSKDRLDRILEGEPGILER
jgi:hypothetical protein